MHKVEIVKIGIDDIYYLKSISEQTFLDTYAKYNTSENMEAHLKEAFNISQLTAEINNKDCEFYFAKIHGEIAGHLKLNLNEAQTDLKDDSSIEMERIYVVKQYQGNKVGRQLVDFTIRRALEIKLNYVWLGVWERNADALQFYKKMGFKEFGTHTFKLGDELQTDLLMKIDLEVT